MIHKLTLAAILVLVLVPWPADLEACTLEISLDCSPGSCVATTENVGAACGGEIVSGFFADAVGDVQILATGLQQCVSSADLPPGTVPQPFAICYGIGTLTPGETFAVHATISGHENIRTLQAFTVVADPQTGNTIAQVWTVDQPDTPSCTPSLASPGIVPSGVPYEVQWTAVSQSGATYEIQESLAPDFTSISSTRTTTGLSSQYQHEVTADTGYFYRVRALSCGGAAGPYSSPAAAIIKAQQPPESTRFDLVAPFGTRQPIVQQVRIPRIGGATAFSITIDQPWLMVSPSTGALGPDGAIVTVTIDPAELPVGATVASLEVSFTAPSSSRAAGEAGSTSIPVSVSLVTPVTTGGKTAPPENALVVPAVAHVVGGALFQSDVRITNPSAGPVDYELFFTPSNSNGLSVGKKTSIRVSAGQTVALNDVVKNFFGYAGPADSIGGSLEIRPVRTSASLTRATSRTYATTALGTLGQFIPAVPVAQFIGTPTTIPGEPPPSGPPPVISLQQVSQNSRFRTNLGLAEGGGETVTGHIRVLSGSGQLLREEEFTLDPAEHRQLNGFLQQRGLTVDDARIEVAVDSPTGRVTSYASVLDNETHDPYLVAPIRPSDIRARRYVLPGVASFDTAASNFFSDVRLYNGGSTAVHATLRLVTLPGFPGGGTTRNITIAPGEVAAYDDILASLFGLAGTGGALIIDTDADSSLVITGRTYSRAAQGTYGQFIPAITSQEGTAIGEPPLEIIQLEQSPEFRSNLGLVELEGRPVTVRLRASLPDSRAAAFMDVPLEPNETIQYSRFLSTGGLNLGTVYNMRVTVEVIGGEGRVAAYGSVVDNRTSDPTYVPAK